MVSRDDLADPCFQAQLQRAEFASEDPYVALHTAVRLAVVLGRVLNRDLSDAPDLDPDLLQTLFDQSVEGRFVVGLQDQARVAKLFNALHKEAGDVLVLAGAFVRDAVPEDDLRAGASHYDALDELAVTNILLKGFIASCTLLVLELGLALDVACRNKEIVQTHHRYTGLLGCWAMLVFKTSSLDAKPAPVPKRDVTVASVLLHGLC